MNAPTYWLNQNCVRHSRTAGGVVVLLRHMNEWLEEQHQTTCSLPEFRDMLKGKGLEVVSVSGTLLVLGLSFKEDWRSPSELKEDWEWLLPSDI